MVVNCQDKDKRRDFDELIFDNYFIEPDQQQKLAFPDIAKLMKVDNY
jgi:spore coat polysaccharide biosynthesis predicted glycosyltransferase SpsG